MKLEYRYGQAYWTDLHPGDIIPDGCGNYKTLTAEDIDDECSIMRLGVFKGVDLDYFLKEVLK